MDDEIADKCNKALSLLQNARKQLGFKSVPFSIEENEEQEEESDSEDIILEANIDTS